MIGRYIFYFYFKEDLSYNKVATQTPIYPGNSYNASNALDRQKGTCMRTEEIGLNSAYHSMWWKVDLGGINNIYSINILFREYTGYGIVHIFFISRVNTSRVQFAMFITVTWVLIKWIINYKKENVYPRYLFDQLKLSLFASFIFFLQKV